MKVLITGCSGDVGKVVSQYLMDQGMEVIGLGRSTPPLPGVHFYKGDVTDYSLVERLVRMSDAVIHLAAYNMPTSAPEQQLFQVNVGGTFHVFKACQVCGIKKVIVASSPNAIGYNFGIKMKDLAYLPVDSQTPLYTTDPYSFGKQCIEEIGRYFYRRYGISSVFMRLGLHFTFTIDEWVVQEPGAGKIRRLRSFVEELMKLPVNQAREKVQWLENDMNERRNIAAGKEYENGTEYVYSEFSEEQEIWNYYVHNYLMFLDKRDLAEAFRLAVEKEIDGSHVVFIADDTNMLGLDARKIAGICYPGAALHYDRLSGCGAMVDVSEAEKLLGFRAKHPISDFYGQLYGEEVEKDV